MKNVYKLSAMRSCEYAFVVWGSLGLLLAVPCTMFLVLYRGLSPSVEGAVVVCALAILLITPLSVKILTGKESLIFYRDVNLHFRRSHANATTAASACSSVSGCDYCRSGNIPRIRAPRLLVRGVLLWPAMSLGRSLWAGACRYGIPVGIGRSAAVSCPVGRVHVDLMPGWVR